MTSLGTFEAFLKLLPCLVCWQWNGWTRLIYYAQSYHSLTMATFRSIPSEIWTNHILSRLSLEDLENLGLTSRFFWTLTKNDSFWIQKIKEDFSHLPLDLSFVDLKANDGTQKGLGWAKEYYFALYRPVRAFLHLA